MDKITKKSLLFGGIVGGLFALVSHTANKQKLTPGQIKDLDSLKTATIDLQKIVSDQSLIQVLDLAKQHEADKQYDEVYSKIDHTISTYNSYLGLVDRFKATLTYILSSSFTSQRANAKTHQVQSSLVTISAVPDLLEGVLKKRIEMLVVIKQGLVYIAAGEADDFKPNDESQLNLLVTETKALETRASSFLSGTSFNQ